ncbi:MAG: hypothetical protein RMM28_11135 [Thermoleophilia bacterium]|nr:hypothetical protein [Gaiellaceae bacterium]MDW8339680.1 hypothetical protein [Thermoleophilia bacterium]
MTYEPIEIARLRQMLKAARPLLRELAIACARAEEELDRLKAHHAQPKEAQHGHDADERTYAAAI